MQTCRSLVFALSFALLSTGAGAADIRPPALSPSGVPAFTEEMLAPEFWIRRAPAPDAVLLSPAQTASRRAAAYADGGGFIDLRRLPATVTRAQVAAWIKQAEQSPSSWPSTRRASR